MEITTDHEKLLKKFVETQEELHRLEYDSHRISQYSKKKDANFQNRSRKIKESKSEKDPHISPNKDMLIKGSSPMQPREDSSSEDELPAKKVCVKSLIRAVTKTESKRDVISKQNINRNVRLRNQRMLGMLQSTLREFQDDAVKRKPQDLKRMAVEQKVEAAKEDAERKMEKEESELNQKIKEKKILLECLEQMMEITESFEAWKSSMQNSLNFIMTETEPRICYLPASHNSITIKKLERSRLERLEYIIQQEKEVMNKLAIIKDSFKDALCNEEEIDVS